MKQCSKDTVGFINDYMLHTYTMLCDIVQFINVTGFAKTIPIGTTIEIQFMA